MPFRNGLGNGMIAASLHGDDGLQVFFRQTAHLLHLEDSRGKRSGLVEHHRVDACQRIQTATSFEQNALSRSRADACKVAQRDANDQCARTGDDEKHQRTVEPQTEVVVERTVQERVGPRQQHCEQGQNNDHRRVDMSKPTYKKLGRSLSLGSLFHHFQDASESRIGRLSPHFQLHRPTHHHHSGQNFLPRRHRSGHTFTGECCGVHLCAGSIGGQNAV